MYVGKCEAGCNCLFCLQAARETALLQVQMLGPPAPPVQIPHGFGSNDKDPFTQTADPDDF